LSRGEVKTKAFDVCVVGHITRDVIRIEATRREILGGTAYYTALALRGLGLDVAVVTKVAKEDEDGLLHDLEADGVEVFCYQTGASSVFENVYQGKNLDERVQRIRAVATPFTAGEVKAIATRVFHVGPLTQRDIPLDLLREISSGSSLVSLDVQGMLRPAHVGTIAEKDWPQKHEALGYVNILKANEKEALVLSGETRADAAAKTLASLGPNEVIITLGSRGSLIYAEQALHLVPSFPAKGRGDPTGCGDTYVAGYLYQRLRGASPQEAGRFGAAMATLKLEGGGPFRGSEADVYARIAAFRRTAFSGADGKRTDARHPRS
jgi:sugar/nucleoside kinase (ribokinase family)